MFKRIIATTAATVTVIAFFACSSNDDTTTETASSSSVAEAPGAPSSSPNGDTSSSSSLSSSSYAAPEIFTSLYDFDGDLPENVIGYAFGTTTIDNDSLSTLDEDGNPVLDVDGNEIKYALWNPDGILTLKNFSFNGGNTTSGDNGGGLMVKEITVNDYSAFRFKVRGTVGFNFRIKVEIENPEGGEPLSAAWQRRITPASPSEFETVRVELAGTGLAKAYDNTGLNLDRTRAVELATIVEFSMREDGTIEIDDLEGLEKQ